MAVSYTHLQGVPVGGEEEAGVLGLQLDPVFQDAVVVAEVETPGGAHAGEDAFSEHGMSKSNNGCESKTEKGHQRPEDVAKDTG